MSYSEHCNCSSSDGANYRAETLIENFPDYFQSDEHLTDTEFCHYLLSATVNFPTFSLSETEKGEFLHRRKKVIPPTH